MTRRGDDQVALRVGASALLTLLGLVLMVVSVLVLTDGDIRQ